MNLILEESDQVPWYTNMRLVFDALPGLCEAHDWLISDIECNSAEERLQDDPVLLSGEELRSIIDSCDIQFIWAVFSALPKGVRPAIPDPPPYADCNPRFWTGSPKPQLPEALVEIVCFDSGSTLLIGAPDEVAAAFKARFTDAADLDERNKQREAKAEESDCG